MTPASVLERSAAKGFIMGNRGDLHGADGDIVRPWLGRAWITCTLVSTRGHRVPFNRLGRYSPLFAVDEATMLAAGHRPCGQCRRGALDRFRTAWSIAHRVPLGQFVLVGAIDDALHAARLDGVGRQRTHRARLADLPDGVMVAVPALDGIGPRAAWLLWGGAMHPWSHEGYGRSEPIQGTAAVDVLTPAPTVAVIRAGYVPEVAL